MANAKITVNNSWYCAYTASNKWVSSVFRGNKYIYCGYADWHGDGGGPFNWRACIEFTAPSGFKKEYKINSFTFVVSTTQKCWPYHAKAYLSSTPPKIVSDNGLDPCGENGVVPKGSGNYTKDYFEDTTITDNFKNKYMASAWATTNSGGTTRPSSSVSSGSNIYFRFTGSSLKLEGDKKYYVYFVRQDDCSNHNGHGNSGFLSALPSTASTTIDYTPEVSFSLKETLNGGSATAFSGKYGTLSHTFTPDANSGSTPDFKVTVGTKYKLTGVTPSTGYECTGGGTTTKTINSDSTHTVDFYRKDSIAYYDSNNTKQDTDYIRYGATLKTRNYTYTVPPCRTFSKWRRGTSNTYFDANKNYGYSSLIPSNQTLGTAVRLYPVFTNNTCTVSYADHPTYTDAYTANIKTQRVTYTKSFVAGDLNGFTLNTNKYVLDGWTIQDSGGNAKNVSHKETVTYDWTVESVTATPRISARKYKIVIYNGTNKIEITDCDYGTDIFTKEFMLSQEASLKVPTHKFIRGWKIRNKDIYPSSTSDWDTLVANSSNNTITLEAILDEDVKIVVYDSKGDRQRVFIKRYNSKTKKWEDLSLQIYDKNNGKWV